MRGVGLRFAFGLGMLTLLLAGCGKEPGSLHRAEQGAVEQTLPSDLLVSFLVVDDADGDGRPDIIATGHGKSLVQVLYQEAPRSFRVSPASDVVGFHPNRLSAVENADGMYLAAAEGSHRLMVLRSDGRDGLVEVTARSQAASFSAQAFEWPGWGTSVVVSPFLGLNCRDPNAQRLTLYKGFSLETAKAEGVGALETPGHCVPGRVTKGDIDGDGIDELLFTTMRSGGVWIVRQSDGNAVPKPELLGKFEASFPRVVVPADLDQDGDLDLLVPLTGRKRLLLWLNKGAGEFFEGPLLPLERRGSPSSVAFGVDRDARAIIAGGQDRVTLFRFPGAGLTDYERIEIPVGGPLNDFVVDDMDGDGWLDLVIARAAREDSLLLIYGPLMDAAAELSRAGTGVGGEAK
jgi:hypothetical protein